MVTPKIHKLLEFVKGKLALLSEEKATPEDIEKVRKNKRFAEFIENFADDLEAMSGEKPDEDAKDEIASQLLYFYKIKDNPAIAKKDPADYTYQQFLKLITGKGSSGKYEPYTKKEEEQRPPDVVFQKSIQPAKSTDKPGEVIVYYGAEDICRRYGKGEKWCITKGSFTNYRASAGRGYPTFYLVKDTTKRDSDKDSFFVIQVKNNGTFAWTDRSNQPYQKDVNSWSDLEARFPILTTKCGEGENCVNTSIKSAMQYKKPTKQELGGSLTLQAWENEPPQEKLRHLKNKLIDNEKPFETYGQGWTEFFKEVLPSYKWVADELVKYAGSLPEAFLSAFSSFTEKQQSNIIKYINSPGSTKNLGASDIWDLNIPTKVKAEIFKAVNYIKNEEGEVISTEPKIDTTVQKDGAVYAAQRKIGSSVKDTIVKLDTKGDEIVVSYQDEDGEHKAEKLNKRTEDLLLKYPHLNDLDISKLTTTVKKHNLDPNIIKKALAADTKGREIVNVGDTYYIIQYLPDEVSISDASGRTSFNDKLPKEVAQKIVDGVKSDATKRASLFQSINKNKAPDLPSDTYTALINNLTPEERTIDIPNNARMYVNAQPGGIVLFKGVNDPDTPSLSMDVRGYVGRSKGPHSYNRDPSRDQLSAATKDALENFIPPLNTDGVEFFFRNTMRWGNVVEYIRANIPSIRLAPDNDFVISDRDDSVWLVNKTNKDASKKYNKSSGNTVNLKISQANYDQVLGRQAQPRTQAAAAAPAAGALPANSAGGNVNLQQVFTDNGLSWTSLTDGLQRKLLQGGTPKTLYEDQTEGWLRVGHQYYIETYNAGDDFTNAGGRNEAGTLFIATARIGGERAVRPRNWTHGSLLKVTVDNGTVSRNNILGENNRGRITAAYQLAGTASALYIATLSNGRTIGIIASQPGNVHGVVTSDSWRAYSGMGNLTNNLNENDIMANKNYLLRKLLERVIKEASPAVAPSEPITKPGTKEPEEEDPFGIPPEKDVDKKPKALGEEAETDKSTEIGKKIINRFKSI